ncbi:MAG: hypothetical protein J6B23_07630 [Clostridia bacterium]|nr:hypothetical protein [Clostridia bacterium]
MLPAMKAKVKFEEKTIGTFGGINTTEGAKSGELADSINMSARNYPSLSSRQTRSLSAQTTDTINGLGTFDGYIFTHYNKTTNKIYLNFGGSDYEFTAYTKSEDLTSTRYFAALSDCILIIPDNIIFYVKTKSFSRICISQSCNPATALNKFLTESKGSELLNNQTIGYIAQLKHNKIICRLTHYSSTVSRAFYYSSFDPVLKAGDIITIKMNVYSERAEEGDEYYDYVDKMSEGVVLKIKDCVKVTHTVPSGTLTETVELLFDDNALDTGGYPDVFIYSFSVERTMPTLDRICAFNNRVWAIAGNQIHTSKLGDASEWNDYSTDDFGTLPYACYTTASQTEGDFTAIVPYGNCIYAFKENVIHKIYGNSPDQYTLYTENFVGTGKKGDGCVQTCINGMIYASYDGIYRYSGDYPQKLSEKLEIPDNLICAASNETSYYLLTGGSEKTIYVYDIKRDVWHKENAPSGSKFMCCYGNKIYLADENHVMCLNITDEKSEFERNIPWSFDIKFDDKDFEKKGFGQLSIRYSLGKNASFTVQTLYDDQSRGAVCGSQFDEASDNSYRLNMPVKRCNWFVLRFRGIGEFKLKSMNMKFYRGSEI